VTAERHARRWSHRDLADNAGAAKNTVQVSEAESAASDFDNVLRMQVALERSIGVVRRDDQQVASSSRSPAWCSRSACVTRRSPRAVRASSGIVEYSDPTAAVACVPARRDTEVYFVAFSLSGPECRLTAKMAWRHRVEHAGACTVTALR
jgi:hypothetical protein